MATVMVTISAAETPTIDEVADRYGLAQGEIDLDFGVIEVADGLFTILVEENVAERIAGQSDWDASGPYSNPRIAPFGPPE